MLFHLVPTDLLVIFQLSAGCVESISYGYVGIFVGVIVLRLAANHDFFAGQGHINTHMK